jgi:signal transduction histidine kinase
LIHVEDNGEGIKAELIKKIFDMFYRASEKAKGSGLGLYIALESAKKIGGTIRLKTEYGTGSCFTIEIPEL